MSQSIREALVLLDWLEEHEIPLSRDAMLALQRLAWDAGEPRVWFEGTGVRQDDQACECGARAVASRHVEGTMSGWSDRYLFECGAVLTWSERGPVEASKPCGDVERRVSAQLEAARQAEPAHGGLLGPPEEPEPTHGLPPCNGCGELDFYESEADGFEVVICHCGVAQAVRRVPA